MILGKESCIQTENRKTVNCRLKTDKKKRLEGKEKYKSNISDGEKNTSNL